MKNILLLSITFFLLFSDALGQEKKIALVIGNATYINGGSLKNPVNDANLIATTLSDLGFEVTKLTNATLVQMQDAVIKFTEKITNYDVALFYYAGHGIQVGGVNFLIPVDAKLEDKLRARYEAFNISDINYAFAQNSGKMNIMILDACRNDPFRSWMRGEERGFMAVSNQAAGTLVAFATREGETASDGIGNNGLYTEKLVAEMKKPQSLIEVFQNTRSEVLKASGNKQCPQEWNMTTGNFYFKKTSGNVNNNTNPDNPVFNPGNAEINYGSISFDTEIAGDLYLDGQKLGYVNANTKGNTLNKITTGNHTFEIRGSENYSQSISVNKDQISYITIKKKTQTQPQNQVTTNDWNTIKEFTVEQKFNSQTTKDYTFNLSSTSGITQAVLVVTGSDYDYDKDGDYTDFTIAVNGTLIFEIKSLKSQGMSGDGSFNDMTVDITKYLKTGLNTITISNTENSGQVDYAFIKKVAIKNKGAVVAVTDYSVLKEYTVEQKFTSQIQKEYTFYLNSTSGINTAQLVINGSDYDYDKDGDYTDFTVSVNGTEIISVTSLKSKGLATDGTYNDLVFNITKNIKSGNNSVIIKNTEDNGQVDYTYIKRVMIKTK
jgi:hypothetical protein